MNIIYYLCIFVVANMIIVEQGETFVPLSDLDAYVYLLEPTKRKGFIDDKAQIEKNIITMLNINIVNDYLKEKDLLSHKAFSNVNDIVNDLEINLDDGFYLKLGINKETAHNSVRKFIVKKENFVRMSDYIKNEFLSGKIDDYIKEQFILNRTKYIKPEKRDISLIKLDSQAYDSQKVKSLLSDLMANDEFDYFSIAATKYSSDNSVKLNQGHLREFREQDFKFPFAEHVFKFSSVGVMPNIFKFEDSFYFIRVNNIVDEIEPKFEDYKESIIKRVMPDLVDNELQNIINTQAVKKVKVNPEVLAHVFERYKVLIEE